MIYKVVGVMSGSSLDGLDIAYCHFQELKGQWTFELIHTHCFELEEEYKNKLRNSTTLSTKDYLILDSHYGFYIGEKIMEFMQLYKLDYKIDFAVIHGHTTFHEPQNYISHQIGHGYSIASKLNLPVITDLRNMDICFGGQGAPIVPMGEKKLFENCSFFLNIGGIANLSAHTLNKTIAFDICSANAVLNFYARKLNQEYDTDGKLAKKGVLSKEVFEQLNQIPYYSSPYPKSLSNEFMKSNVLPILENFNSSIEDKINTYCEHIAFQIFRSIEMVVEQETQFTEKKKLMITGGGAFNNFLIECIQKNISKLGFEIELPTEKIIKFKEALIMAFLGVLRWRLEPNVLASVTGASKNTINGTLFQP